MDCGISNGLAAIMGALVGGPRVISKHMGK
jgi:hypothetical protein